MNRLSTHPIFGLAMLALIIGALQLTVWHLSQHYGTVTGRARKAVSR